MLDGDQPATELVGGLFEPESSLRVKRRVITEPEDDCGWIGNEIDVIVAEKQRLDDRGRHDSLASSGRSG
jgi:hypothetical protein